LVDIAGHMDADLELVRPYRQRILDGSRIHTLPCQCRAALA
jgi:hypothetical protein